MRITNTMVSNNMLLNINRNTSAYNEIMRQLSSGKIISRPSDDPIIASRALKFRTNVSETEQYQRNVKQGISWMSSTEHALSKTLDSVLQTKYLATEASSGSYTASDRATMANEMNQYFLEFGSQMNTSYAGRYLFSGLRTDEPPVFTTDDDSGISYNINQDFAASDIQKTKSFQKLNLTDEPITYDINMLKLPYTNATNLTITSTPALLVNTISKTDPNAYVTAAGTVNYIPETGELIINDADVLAFTDAVVTYDKTGFLKNELNPKVYFDCTDSNGVTYNMDNQEMNYEVSSNVRLKVNTLAKDVYTDKLYADMRDMMALMKDLNTGFSDEAKLTEKYSQPPHNLAGTALTTAVKDQMASEVNTVQTILHDRYSDLMGLMDKHSTVVTLGHTELGSRQQRMDMIDTRLADDVVNYTELRDNNEGVDYAKASMQYANAQTIYNAALQVGANIIQTSLVNFLR